MKRDTRMLDPVCYLGPEDRWKALGLAIVKQAVVDWREAEMKLSSPETATFEINNQKNSAEHFLRSNLVELYSGLDGKTLLRKMKAGII